MLGTLTFSEIKVIRSVGICHSEIGKRLNDGAMERSRNTKGLGYVRGAFQIDTVVWTRRLGSGFFLTETVTN